MRHLVRLTSLLIVLSLGPLTNAHASVLHSIGVARGEDDAVRYIEHHQYFETGEHLISYYDTDLQLLLTKELNYPALPQHPTLKQKDFRLDSEITIEAEEAIALMTRSFPDSQEVFQFELSKDIVIDAGFDAYIRSQWATFDENPVQQFRFAVAGQPRLVKMEIRRIDSTEDGASFTVTPRNWLIRMILPVISLSYDSNRQLARYQGFSNLKTEGTGRDVEISFTHYQMNAPLALPLDEWLPVAKRS